MTVLDQCLVEDFHMLVSSTIYNYFSWLYLSDICSEFVIHLESPRIVEACINAKVCAQSPVKGSSYYWEFHRIFHAMGAYMCTHVSHTLNRVIVFCQGL